MQDTFELLSTNRDLARDASASMNELKRFSFKATFVLDLHFFLGFNVLNKRSF
jgi:hypothetical protein